MRTRRSDGGSLKYTRKLGTEGSIMAYHAPAITNVMQAALPGFLHPSSPSAPPTTRPASSAST